MNRSTVHTLLALALVLALPAVAGAVAVGDAAPAFSLTDLSGETVSLDDFDGQVVVLEWINPNCPFSKRHSVEGTMAGLADDHEVVWLGINSTNPDHGDFLEPAEHQAFNDEHGVDYRVLYDPTGETGHAYDAKTTPHMFVIGADRKIAYAGAIDDDPRGSTAAAERDNYVDGALVALAASSSPDPAATNPYGCSVKY